MALRRTTAMVVSALVVLAMSGAHADEAECYYSVDEASAQLPHAIDPPNDWVGPVFGDGSTGLGDLHREGIDVTASWIARNDEDVLQAHIQVQNLSFAQPNAFFYMSWTYEGDDPLRKFRWVSARMKGYEVDYTYGYFAGGTLPNSNGTFATIGETTGSIVEGPSGELIIDIPATGSGTDRLAGDIPVPAYNWGAPTPGSILSFLPSAENINAPWAAESRILVGSPEPLPPPSPVRHGYVYEADTAENTYPICDAVV